MYKLPETLEADIEKFASLAKDYQEKKIESVQFKAFRVPMGIYEQRQDDVYMSRVRTTGGVIYPKQLLEIIEIARRHRSNLLHITTRQEIQIQNLDLDEVEFVLHDLQKIGLSTKGGGGNTIRNIIVSEFSGIDSSEQFDATPYAMDLTTLLIAEADSYLLPRKMKIAFSSNDKQIGYAAVNDIGFVAKVKDGEKGFLVYAGGGAGAKPTTGWKLFDFIPATDLYILAESLKKFFSDYGNRKNRHKARLRFVFYKLGEQETIRLIQEYYYNLKKEITEPFLVDPDFDKRPTIAYQPVAQTLDQNYPLWLKRYVSPQKQDKYNTILVPFLLGNIPVDDEDFVQKFQKLLHFVDKFGDYTLRFTTTQSIRLRNIPDEALPELYLVLSDLFPDIYLPTLINNTVSCTGADTCRLGIGLSKGLAKAIRKELVKSNLDLDKLQETRIHISGCPNSCGQQLWADIGFSGKILRNDRVYPGYQVYLGANRDQSPKFAEAVGNISSRDIPQFVVKLLDSYLQTQEKYQSLQQFLLTEGKEIAQLLLADFKAVPPFEDDKNYYFDWGAETLFSIVNRGTAECSAGLFDMIDVDQNIINSTKAVLEKETDTARRNLLLYEILFSASRMLLVTRGVEPKNTEDVFSLFLKSFIDFGFVDDKFRQIVTIGRENKDFNFETKKDGIYALSDAVTELYKNMDDSLQFKNVQPKVKVEEPAPTVDAREVMKPNEPKFKDLRGVACPMNFVQTKIQLSPMQSGEILEIWLDDGQPINNVPGSVRGEGHQVVEQVQVGDYWKVVIKKK
ncbi:MAG: ferredoxin-nitrite reductase [Bacteroidetes bacterium]|nr:ferredoxin-nitrite reductase [Bacteroidota bacterium]